MLNNEESIKLLTVLESYAIFFGEKIEKKFLADYISSLEMVYDKTLEQYVNAINQYTHSNNYKFPVPAQLGKYLNVKLNNRDVAIEISTLILKCISKYGSWNRDLALKEIGTLGWIAVEMYGGWENICLLEIDRTNIFLAQMRDIINSLLERKDYEKIESLPIENNMQNYLKSRG